MRWRWSQLPEVFALSLLASACQREPKVSDPPPPAAVAHVVVPPVQSAGAPPAANNLAAQELTWDYPSTPFGPMQVVVSVPARKTAAERLPVLIALHGRGETRKGPERGARGWIDDYWLPRALARLKAPPLTERDLLGMVDRARLGAINQSLTARPYQGLIVVCPYTHEALAGKGGFEAAEPFGRFLVDQVLGRVQRETPALPGPGAVGIDGVSLGGRGALLVGLALPEAFGSVGTLQAAFDREDAEGLAQAAKRASAQNPKLSLRLLTSDDDYFLDANRAISRAFQAAEVRHRFVVVPGVHDYAFNRGPGVYEMLLHHDRALRGEPLLD